MYLYHYDLNIFKLHIYIYVYNELVANSLLSIFKSYKEINVLQQNLKF